MGISYEESVKKFATEHRSVLANKTIGLFSANNDFIAANSEAWILDDKKYSYYPDYSDDVYSTIDKQKSIILSSSQINVTQETNSQYIPFRMNRYYDGFDLTGATLSIYFVNRNDRGYTAKPINVYYNDTTIRFAWLVDRRATAVSGSIRFEIRAVGINSKGEDYVWKTQPSDGINVIESLTGNDYSPGDDEDDVTDTSWIAESINQMEQQVETLVSNTSGIAESLNKIEQRVGDLEYKPITITSFTNSVGTREVGDIVSDVTLNWKISRTPTSLLLDSEPIDVTLPSLSISDQEIISDRQWKLVAIDERGKASSPSTTSINFRHRVFYGIADLPEVVDSAFMKKLTYSSLSTSRTREFTIEATGSKYIWYCVPTEFGECQFKIGGNYGGLGLVDTIEYTNGNYTGKYYVYRNGHEGIGRVTIEVV